jgi:Pentapeptide repeats (8 copies)
LSHSTAVEGADRMFKAAGTFVLASILALPAGRAPALADSLGNAFVEPFVFTLVTPEADITAREVTERLYKVKAGERMDLSGRDLTYLDFSTLDFKGASLARTDLYGADFTGASLKGAPTSLEPTSPAQPFCAPPSIPISTACSPMRRASPAPTSAASRFKLIYPVPTSAAQI